MLASELVFIIYFMLIRFWLALFLLQLMTIGQVHGYHAQYSQGRCQAKVVCMHLIAIFLIPKWLGHLPYIVKIIVVAVLATQGAKASTTMIWTYFPRNIPVANTQGVIYEILTFIMHASVSLVALVMSSRGC